MQTFCLRWTGSCGIHGQTICTCGVGPLFCLATKWQCHSSPGNYPVCSQMGLLVVTQVTLVRQGSPSFRSTSNLTHCVVFKMRSDVKVFIAYVHIQVLDTAPGGCSPFTEPQLTFISEILSGIKKKRWPVIWWNELLAWNEHPVSRGKAAKSTPLREHSLDSLIKWRVWAWWKYGLWQIIQKVEIKADIEYSLTVFKFSYSVFKDFVSIKFVVQIV